MDFALNRGIATHYSSGEGRIPAHNRGWRLVRDKPTEVNSLLLAIVYYWEEAYLIRMLAAMILP